MNCRCLWVLMVLGLPAVAAAEGAAGPAVPIPESRPAVELAAPAEPKLDLKLDPGHLPSVQNIRPVSSSASRRASPPDAGPPVEKALTFGLDVRTRHRVGDEVRADVAAPPSVGEQIKSTLDRSTFGVTGTYRF